MKQWVDVPGGWAYGWPKLYDPEKDGDLLEWIHRMGYKGTLAGVRCWYQEEETIAKLDGGKYKLGRFITRAKGVTWDIFFEKDAVGNHTGALIQRYSSIWHDAEKRMLDDRDKKVRSVTKNPTKSIYQKIKAIENGRREKLKWVVIIVTGKVVFNKPSPELVDALRRHKAIAAGVVKVRSS